MAPPLDEQQSWRRSAVAKGFLVGIWIESKCAVIACHRLGPTTGDGRQAQSCPGPPLAEQHMLAGSAFAVDTELLVNGCPR